MDIQVFLQDIIEMQYVAIAALFIAIVAMVLYMYLDDRRMKKRNGGKK